MRNISSIFLNLKAKEVQPVTIKVYLINCLMSVYTHIDSIEKSLSVQMTIMAKRLFKLVGKNFILMHRDIFISVKRNNSC